VERVTLTPQSSDIGSWTTRLIECGTGIASHLSGEGDPVRDWEARLASWQKAVPTIQKLEADVAEGRPVPLLRFAFFRLVDLSLRDYRERWSIKNTLKDLTHGKLSPRSEYTLLQRPPSDRAGSHAQNRPNQDDILRVLSALVSFLDDWRLPRNKIGKRRKDLAHLVSYVFPPLFLLTSRKKRGRERLLSEIISKHRDPLEPGLTKELRKERRLQAGEADYEGLVASMQRIASPT